MSAPIAEALTPEQRRRYQTLVTLLEVLSAAHAIAEQQGEEQLRGSHLALTMAVRARSFYGIAPRIISDRRQDDGFLVVGLTLRECATLAVALIEELGLSLAVPHPDNPGEHLR